MTLKHIRLELARTKDRPDGDARCGYEFAAPLDAAGHFDAEGWKAGKALCSVRRFWHGADDEPIFKFDRHTFVPGEYVTITEHDGVARPFKVVSVR